MEGTCQGEIEGKTGCVKVEPGSVGPRMLGGSDLYLC